MSDDARDNPYVGLRPFLAEDSLTFFGRETQVTGLLDILREQRFLGVVGSSGSGKSSLVRAGLIPALLGGFLVGDRDSWHLVQIRPGDAPLTNLADAVAEALDASHADGRELEDRIRQDHIPALLDFVASRLSPNASLFILVDQFEEIFSYRQRSSALGDEGNRERARRHAEAVAYVDLLLRLAKARELPIYVALTMRTDFLGDCDLFYGLPEALNQGRYLIPRMTRDELRDAVECPAMLRGAQFAPRLSDQVLNELGDRFDRLPLLQHALMRTWDAWQRDGGIGPIDLEHYDAIGGLERALNGDADLATAGLDEIIVARVFKRLVDTDPAQRRVRSPARISQLAEVAGADRASVEAILEPFQSNGRSFLYRSADGDAEDPSVDISHESLIRRWDKLWTWASEEQRHRDEFIELVRRARRWETGAAAPLQGPELTALADWKDHASPSPAWAARYCAAADDYDVATQYVETSVSQRRDVLAAEALRRRWGQSWGPGIVMFEALIGIGLTARYDLFKALDQLKGDIVHQTDFIDKAWALLGLFVTGSFVATLFYIALCLAFYVWAKQFHRATSLPRIRRQLQERGWRIEPQLQKERDARLQLCTDYASAPRRFLAYLIDLLLFVVIAASTMLLLLTNTIPFNEGTLLGCLIFLISYWWLSSTLPIASRYQATFGMHRAGIFRTDLSGERLSFVRANALFAARILSYIFYGFGFFIQPFTARRQTFHDMMARSVVLRGRAGTSQPADTGTEWLQPAAN